jgi:hypothetical protein
MSRHREMTRCRCRKWSRLRGGFRNLGELIVLGLARTFRAKKTRIGQLGLSEKGGDHLTSRVTVGVAGGKVLSNRNPWEMARIPCRAPSFTAWDSSQNSI